MSGVLEVGTEGLFKSLRLLLGRNILTGTMAAAALLLPFYESIGLNQFWLGVVMAWFIAINMVLTVPAGWLADRISRRWFVIIGDVIAAAGFVLYAVAGGLGGVLLAEGVMAIGASLSGGADDGLLNSYLSRLDRRRSRNERFRSKVAVGRPAAQIILLAVVAVIYYATKDMRSAFLIGAVPFAAGAVMAGVMIEDDESGTNGPRGTKQAVHRRLAALLKAGGRKLMHPGQLIGWLRGVGEHLAGAGRQLGATLAQAHKEPRLFRLLVAYAIAFRLTTPLNVVLSAVMIEAGIKIELVAALWIIKPVAVTTGSFVAGKVGATLGPFGRFFLPATGIVVALGVMSYRLTPATVLLYFVIGFAEGWYQVLMMPMVQAVVPHDHQSTVSSTAEALSQALHLVLLLAVSYAASIDVRMMLTLAFVGYAVLLIAPVAISLYRIKLPGEDELITWPKESR